MSDLRRFSQVEAFEKKKVESVEDHSPPCRLPDRPEVLRNWVALVQVDPQMVAVVLEFLQPFADNFVRRIRTYICVKVAIIEL
jgi:hypothetical protein